MSWPSGARQVQAQPGVGEAQVLAVDAHQLRAAQRPGEAQQQGAVAQPGEVAGAGGDQLAELRRGQRRGAAGPTAVPALDAAQRGLDGGVGRRSTPASAGGVGGRWRPAPFRRRTAVRGGERGEMGGHCGGRRRQRDAHGSYPRAIRTTLGRRVAHPILPLLSVRSGQRAAGTSERPARRGVRPIVNPAWSPARCRPPARGKPRSSPWRCCQASRQLIAGQQFCLARAECDRVFYCVTMAPSATKLESWRRWARALTKPSEWPNSHTPQTGHCGFDRAARALVGHANLPAARPRGGAATQTRYRNEPVVDAAVCGIAPAVDRHMGLDRAAFDTWLSKALHAGHDAVMAEPMPDEWLRLILECPRAEGNSDSDRGARPARYAAAPQRLRSAGARAG